MAGRQQQQSPGDKRFHASHGVPSRYSVSKRPITADDSMTGRPGNKPSPYGDWQFG
jgi:hypothetical protein